MRLKALHIAAFDGNVGDIGQILGFRQQLMQNTKLEIEFTNLEIREFYYSWGMRRFDDDFIGLANKYDVVIFGGGNFWSVDWKQSPNGTTLGLSIDSLKKIKTPIWFNAIGFDDGLNFMQDKLNDFIEFLSYITSEDRFFVSVRNDSSYELLMKYTKTDVLDKVVIVPDGGFFIKPYDYGNHVELSANKKNIVINPAGDMEAIRFSSGYTANEYLADFGKGLRDLLENFSDINLVFVAHHHDDLRYISCLINLLSDWDRRRRVSVAPFVPNWGRADYVFDLYKKADIVIGGRFHSNLCAIAQGTPTVGILSYHKHKYIYKKYGLQNRMLEVDKGEVVLLKEKISSMLCEYELNKARKENDNLVAKLGIDICNTHQKAEKWISDILFQ